MNYLIPLLLLFLTLSGCRLMKVGQPQEFPNGSELSDPYADIIRPFPKDTLYSFCRGTEQGDDLCGFAEANGDTIIAPGKFSAILSEQFYTYVFVYDQTFNPGKVIALNRKGQVIFEAYLFDNGTDYTVEGLFRIRRNGKIGFANENGEVIIPAIYACADAFENGKARVALNCTLVPDGEHTAMESDEWFYIDKRGKKTH